MERLIYCPSDKEIEKASDLSKLIKLQIQIGESDKSKNLSFDRSKIQVLEIPEDNDLFSFGNVQQYFHQCIIYVDEFKILKNKIQLKINNKLIKSTFEEKHRVKYSYFCEKLGINTGQLYYENKIIREFDFVVNKKV